MTTGTILVVDDDETTLAIIGAFLDKLGYIHAAARNGEEAIAAVARLNPSLVFLDVVMPGLDGIETLRRLKQSHPSIPVVINTSSGTMQTAIQAMQLGAFEYILKPVELATLRDVTQKALHMEEGRDRAFRVYPLAVITDRRELVGNAPAMHEVYKLVGSISMTPHRTSVLILGESGTGKELIARAIHENGPTRGEPFLAINCTALPETLLESELFGHEKGAFTGASERKLGKFEIAAKGTIFLDEIGDLPAETQKKLLRVLQERIVERLGGHESFPVGARFIAATNRDLDKLVRDGSFREDLFYRLNVVTVSLPPLRKRPGDIPLLAGYFLAMFNNQLARAIQGFSEEAMSVLRSYDYPGNVRELENIIEKAVMLTRGDIVLPDALGPLGSRELPDVPPVPVVSGNFAEARDHVLRLFERQFVERSLNAHKGNVTAAAKSAGMTRQNFQRLMQRHDIRSETFR